ncbi:heavy metal translocating P-type ATPase [Chroococcidiopsis thermalis]|uniref:P-type Cu(+) transporter n=1 Tax=Chroococcidiopsis thermalis (strain PCC 7203) TaxID=251229 RepID=K9U8Z7_CHRTP|nr:heavy metal translocating P-type ATPase [Chroococcidiopsis thermalis]AFY90724.1 heavy metal translocating P-type ATPase [Chroococcidiopsis thermalis PCC 7203]
MQLVPKTEPQQADTSAIAAPSEKITLDVQGMKCAGCVKTVEKQLSQHPGVISACVNLVTEVAVVECESGAVEPVALAERLTAAGFETQARTAETAQTNVGEDVEAKHRQKMRSAQRQLIVASILLVLSSIGHLSELGGPVLPILSNIWFHCGLATVTLLLPAREILVDGWRGLRHNAPNMNTLVGLGALTAYTASLVALLFPQLGWECFFDEPVMLLGFILLGRTLEQQARGRAATAFRNLLALQPQVARLIPNPEKVTPKGQNTSIEIPADRVRVGEWLQVLPSEKIPVDGEVVIGQTTVDESMLTGESIPVMKQIGDTVAAGTLNQSGAIAIRATRTGKDTTLSQIVALVEAAQTRKAPVQKLADTVAGYFTYSVLTVAALTFTFWYFFGTHIWSDVLTVTDWHHAHHSLHTQHLAHYYATHHACTGAQPCAPTHYSPLLLSLKLAIAVMVVACPCALGLATPTAILVGTGMAAERGLLIKGGDVLERVHQLDTVVFDKTGTLTTGHPVVTDCIEVGSRESGIGSRRRELREQDNSQFAPFRNSQLIHHTPHPTPHTLIQLAAAAESGSIHPLATAIQQEVKQQGLSIPAASEFHTAPGLGVSAVVEGRQVLLGNEDWLTQQGIAIDEATQAQAQTLAVAGKTTIYIAVAGQLAGLIAVMDTPRPEAKKTVESLQKMGLRVIILTGDRQEVAQAIAQQLGIAQVFANIRPDGKAGVIQELQQGSRGAEEQRSREEIQNFPTPHSSLLTPRSSVVAMIGDGINDAPALAQADVGIALQAGTDVAMETAGIVLMGTKLTDVVEAIHLSRATFNKIRQNLFWAFAYNVCGIPIAAGVLLPILGFVLSPAAAGALMAFSSVSVVTNSLLLRRLKNRLDLN